MSLLLDVRNLKAYYEIKNIGRVKAVDGVSLKLGEGEVVGIVGESGSGKSTLAKAIMLDITYPLKLVDGSIIIEGIDITKIDRERLRREIWGRKISIIPQSAMNALIPTLRVRDLIKDVLKEKISTNISKEGYMSMILESFKSLNLPEIAASMYPFELSGGMRQRVLIALATLLKPSILIADEPTSALDVSTQKIVIDTLLEVYKNRFVKSIVFITHDIATVRQIATRIIVMYAGKFVEDEPVENIIYDPLHPYTKSLVGSILTPEPEVRERVKKKEMYILRGEPPSLINPPPGCRFHPRCPFAMDICRKEEPPLTKIENNRYTACWLYLKR